MAHPVTVFVFNQGDRFKVTEGKYADCKGTVTGTFPQLYGVRLDGQRLGFKLALSAQIMKPIVHVVPKHGPRIKNVPT